jgi:hypothetical protein
MICFSRRNSPELRSSDTLAIILLIKHLFPSNEKIEDLFSYSYRKLDQTVVTQPKMVYQPQHQHSDRYHSAKDEMEDDDPDEKVICHIG